jgi:coiled-coil family 90 protein
LVPPSGKRQLVMAIDTLKVAKRLREAGFTDPQAEAVVASVQEAAEGAEFATKGDLDEVRSELKADIAALRGELREIELRLEAKIREAELRLEAKIRESELRLEGRLQAVQSDVLNRVFGLVLGALIVNIVAMIGAVFAVAKMLGH